MSRAISLHQLCALEITPWTLVEVAARAGYDHVCVCTQGPPNPAIRFPLVAAGEATAFRRHVADHGLSVLNIEACFLTATADVAGFRAALETGRSIGGRSVTVVSLDPDPLRARDNFEAVCMLAGEIGLIANLEFMAISPTVATLEQAADWVRGTAHAALAIDALHVVRTGAAVAEIAALDPALIGYLQLCDGPATRPEEEWRAEAIGGRRVPGEGEFPLVDLLRAVPADLPVSLEVPMNHRRDGEGVDAAGRASMLIAGTRAVLARAR
ncbi:sugar phosphate isomerase/epimerase family protein [Sphingomonas mali]|uniref:sugar phosphate isomerase/epimerase family protein n=1 Tax=Sphingomonas mali TaxID=40682 RepID=UPI00083701EC|nr:TIM barrel protein [Sphingomonas mali]